MRRGRVSGVAALLCLALLVTGCSSRNERDPRLVPPPNPFTQDKDIRPVRMATSRAFTYVMRGTAAQILCQALAKDRWAQLLGGPVGRQPQLAGGCTISSDRASVSLWTNGSQNFLQPNTTVGGRPAHSLPAPAAGFSVALTDEAVRSPKHLAAMPILNITVNSGDREPAALHELAEQVANELVPALAKAGDPLPDIDDHEQVRYASTPVSARGEIIDIPRPVQALQLCTLIQETPGLRVDGAQVELNAFGDCRVRTPDGGLIELGMESGGADLTAYVDSVGGRPARTVTEPKPVLRVRLRSDAEVDLTVKAADSVALAEQLVPLLLSP